MNQERILVVEDELKIAELHRDYLEQSGFRVSILGRGDEGGKSDTKRACGSDSP